MQGILISHLSFFAKQGNFFPAPGITTRNLNWYWLPKALAAEWVGDHIGNFDEGDLVFMSPLLPHVWVNDEVFINGTTGYAADAIGIHFVENFLGEIFLQIPEYEVGFNNLGNFNRQFKKYKKMTPRDYRKKLNIDFIDEEFMIDAYQMKTIDHGK